MNEKTRIQWRPIGEVHPYPNNPRNNDDAVEYIDKAGGFEKLAEWGLV